MIRSLLLAGVVLPLAVLPTSANEMTPRQVRLVDEMVGFSHWDVSYEEALDRITRTFNSFDTDRTGLTADEIVTKLQVLASMRRASSMDTLLSYDINRDRQIPRAEFEAVSGLGMGSIVNAEDAIRIFETRDWDGDSVITFAEMTEDPMNGPSSIWNRGTTELLELAAASKDTGEFTKAELLGILDAFYAQFDLDSNGVISSQENQAIRALADAQIANEEYDAPVTGRSPCYPLPVEACASVNNSDTDPVMPDPLVTESYLAFLREHCAVPAAGGDAEVLLVAAFMGHDHSTVGVDNPQQPTSVATVTVEPGASPVYLALTSAEQVIWKIEGAVERIEHVLVGGWNQGGVTGLEKEKVTAFFTRDCLNYARDLTSEQGQDIIRVTGELVGRSVSNSVATYELDTVQVPSLAMVEGADGIGEVAEIDAASVIAPAFAFDYPVPPRQAGLQALVKAGALEKVDEKTYRVLKDFRSFPPGLVGKHAVRFLIGAEGIRFNDQYYDWGHSCLVYPSGSMSDRHGLCDEF